MIVVLLLQSGRLHAQRDDPTRARFDQAMQLYDKGDFEGALRGFQALREAQPISDLLRLIGRCHLKLRHGQEALEAFQRYLQQETGLSSEDQKRVNELIEKAQALLRGEVEVHGPNGAWFQVDAMPRQRLPDQPVRIPLPRGRHTVLFETGSQGVEVRAGEVVVVSRPMARPQPPGPKPSPLPPMKWALLGAGLLAAGAGAALLAVDGRFTRPCAPPDVVCDHEELWTQPGGIAAITAGTVAALGATVVFVLDARGRARVERIAADERSAYMSVIPGVSAP